MFGPPNIIIKGDYGNMKNVTLVITLNSGKTVFGTTRRDPKTGRPLAEKLELEIRN